MSYQSLEAYRNAGAALRDMLAAGVDGVDEQQQPVKFRMESVQGGVKAIYPQPGGTRKLELTEYIAGFSMAATMADPGPHPYLVQEVGVLTECIVSADKQVQTNSARRAADSLRQIPIPDNDWHRNRQLMFFERMATQHNTDYLLHMVDVLRPKYVDLVLSTHQGGFHG
jgi:hypothetical protein